MYHRQGREEGRGKLTHLVNFNNILRAAFLPISLRRKSLNLQCKYRKAALKSFVQKKLLVKCW